MALKIIEMLKTPKTSIFEGIQKEPKNGQKQPKKFIWIPNL
jgi:hypothetical protein